MDKQKRGGKRKGAGRPRKAESEKKQKFTFKIMNVDLIEQLTENLPRKRDAYIEQAVLEKAIKDGLYNPK